MKKALLLSLLMLSAFFANAQRYWHNQSEYGIKLGVQGGMNVSNWTNYDEISTGLDSRISFNAGVQAEIPLSRQFYLQPELSYASLGFRTPSINDIRITEKTDYLSLPILVKYKFGSSGFGIFLGPQYSYLLSSKTSVSGDTEKADTEVGITDKSALNKSDLSAVFGGEYYLPMGLGFAARYQLGFTNILKKSVLEEDGASSPKNLVFALTVGYRF